MKKIIAAISLALAVMTFTGCNSAAKNWGGKMTINLPAGEKLVMCEWDESDGLWYLTRPMHPYKKRYKRQIFGCRRSSKTLE